MYDWLNPLWIQVTQSVREYVYYTEIRRLLNAKYEQCTITQTIGKSLDLIVIAFDGHGILKNTNYNL